MPRAFFTALTIGTGVMDNPYRPELADEPGIEGWAACYEQDAEARSLVLVKAPQAVLDTLALTYDRVYSDVEVGLAV
jgi:hypothetical protein